MSPEGWCDFLLAVKKQAAKPLTSHQNLSQTSELALEMYVLCTMWRCPLAVFALKAFIFMQQTSRHHWRLGQMSLGERIHRCLSQLNNFAPGSLYFCSLLQTNIFLLSLVALVYVYPCPYMWIHLNVFFSCYKVFLRVTQRVPAPLQESSLWDEVAAQSNFNKILSQCPFIGFQLGIYVQNIIFFMSCLCWFNVAETWGGTGPVQTAAHKNETESDARGEGIKNASETLAAQTQVKFSDLSLVANLSLSHSTHSQQMIV